MYLYEADARKITFSNVEDPIEVFFFGRCSGCQYFQTSIKVFGVQFMFYCLIYSKLISSGLNLLKIFNIILCINLKF